MRVFPTWKQFKDWSLPSKYTFIGFMLGSVLSGVSVYLSVRPNPQLIMLEKVLRAEKPTKLVAKSLEVSRHIGVDRELVFVEIENQSSRPAYRFQAKLVVGESAIDVPTDRSVAIYSSGTLAIPAQESLRLPVAYESDVLSALELPCISGFSLSPNLSGYDARAVPLAIDYGHTTVFEENVSSLTAVWAIVPRACG